uniref:ERCC4 domain-containing protein n=1 Tax=Macrostomum lignano TaxID=282301 RepID=A0A1I8FI17_9PLAT
PCRPSFAQIFQTEVRFEKALELAKSPAVANCSNCRSPRFARRSAGCGLAGAPSACWSAWPALSAYRLRTELGRRKLVAHLVEEHLRLLTRGRPIVYVVEEHQEGPAQMAGRRSARRGRARLRLMLLHIDAPRTCRCPSWTASPTPGCRPAGRAGRHGRPQRRVHHGER